jgi:hypothetical protein
MHFDPDSVLHWLFVVLGVGASVFYGVAACSVFGVTSQGRSRAWRIHQFWLNLLGSAVGWVAAWAVLGAVAECQATACSLSLSPSAVAVFVLAFLGVTGHLPAALVGLVGGIAELAAKLVSLIGGRP